jgi:hypothetical protein
MSADGPEQRTAELEERSERESDRIDVIEDRADSQTDEALLATSREVLEATRAARGTIARLLEENEAVWQAGHDAGYRAGYLKAMADARKIIDEKLGPLVKS